MTPQELSCLETPAKITIPATIVQVRLRQEPGTPIDDVTLYIKGVGRVTLNPAQLRDARHENQA